MTTITSAEREALDLDAADPLPTRRAQFHVPPYGAGETAYLAGNSLGLQPKALRGRLGAELDDWARLGVEGHLEAQRPWLSYHGLLREPAARLVGARPEEVVVMNSLTVNLHLLMVSFYRPTPARHAIVIEDSAFPSDSYAVRSQVAFRGYDPDEAVIRLKPRPGEAVLRTEDVVDFLRADGASVAMVLLGAVNYYTGELFDMDAITAAGHKAGAVVGWDLAHAVGNVPLTLHATGADWAAWCSYKYLNAGPGSLRGAFVHERHLANRVLPKLAGWWSTEEGARFQMAPRVTPVDTADSWQLSNPPILAMAPVLVSLEMFDETGMPALRAKSMRLTGYLQELLDGVCQARPGVSVITPRDPRRRGAQLSVRIDGRDASPLTVALRQESGVIADARRPDVIRLAPAPLYNTFHDCWRAATALAAVLDGHPAQLDDLAAMAERVAIAGAGLAGCLLATLLARRGIGATVFERREDPRVTGPERGRSINLAISARGLEALSQVGLREQALSRALPMHGRMVHSRAGQQSFRPYSADGRHAINSISRAELNLALLEVAERAPGVSVRFAHRLRELDMATGELTFDTPDGVRRFPADIVLAADGAYSAARRAVTFRPGFTFSQDYLEHGYKELTIPPSNGTFALDPDALHIWPRGTSMMIALPNLDRSFTCTLFWTQEDFAALTSPSQVRAHFAEHYPDVAGLIPALADDYQRDPVGSLATIRCWPWVHHGDGAALALVGDAAHAIVPFFGQGANCALEDCIEIDRCLSDADGDWRAALGHYERRRKANCDAIADMALDNFIEMRDRVNSRRFQAQVAARHFLERRLPGRYVSRYELVSFTTMPYAQIPDRMRRQDQATALVVAGMAGLLAAAARHGLTRRNGR